MTETKEKFCRKCKKLLIAGENITQKKLNKSQYICTTCYREQSKYYRDLYASGSKWAEYIAERREQEIEKFSEQWNDPKYQGIKEMSDKLFKVFDDYERKTPETGIQRDWACEVVFENMWNISPNDTVDDFLESSNLKRQAKIFARQYILEFVVGKTDVLQVGYREQARNKWHSLIESLNKKYAGKAEMVATPRFENPHTKQTEANWYLLTYKPHQLERENIRNGKIESMNRKTDYERKLVATTVKEEIKHKQEQEPEHQDTNNTNSENEQ